MSFSNHLIFSLFCCVIFIKYLNINFNINLLNLIISCLFVSLLPDIDHNNSFIGSKFKYISYYIFKYFGHRNITHSFIFLYLLYIFIFHYKYLYYLNIDISVKYGIIIGYLSHILADMFTIKGVNIFWPLNFNFKFPFIYIKSKKLEYIVCIYLLFISIFWENLICILKILFKNIYII